MFPIITLFILLINSFIVCSEEVYPPGEIYAVEKIITDSYPDTRQRAQNARDLGNKIVLVGGGNILMEVMLSISGNI